MTEPFTIRPAGPRDTGDLALVGAATFLETYAHLVSGADIALHCRRQHSAEAYAQRLRAGARAWLAGHPATGAAIGYALNTAPDLPVATGANDVELKRIYLMSKFQGAGTGKALLKAAIEDARDRGADRLWLGTYRHNAQALGFYRAMGFETAGTRTFQVGDGVYDDFVLALTL